MLAFTLTAFPTNATAQNDIVEETSSKRFERELQLDVAIRKAAKKADTDNALNAKAEVTYADVMADPDNLELNFRFAKTQVAQGNLTGASATLERILMIDPNIPSVRLFLALVYFNLDNLDESEREFNTLIEGPISEEHSKQARQYLKEIRKRRRTTRFVAGTSLGWGFETNRNAAPSSKERMFLNTPTPLTGTSKKRRDTNALVVNSLAFEHDLGFQSGHQWIGSFDYFLGEQTTADDLDLQSFGLESGLVLKMPSFTLTPTGFANYIYLSRESFMRSQGLGLRADRELGARLTVGSSVSWTREDYMPITENTSARERNGNRYNLDLSSSYALNPKMLLGATFSVEDKSIKGPANYNAYEGYSASLSHTWLLGKGQFLLSMLTYGINEYDEVDISISKSKRRDEQLRGRLTYGLPVSLITGRWLPPFVVKDMTATASLEQFRSLSSITNYTYSNTKFGLLLSKRVEF